MTFKDSFCIIVPLASGCFLIWFVKADFLRLKNAPGRLSIIKTYKNPGAFHFFLFYFKLL